MNKYIEIVKTPEVLGGKPRIKGTRIGVRVIGEMVRRGDWTVEEITSDEHFLDLTRDGVEAALVYYDDHPDEMETLRAQREASFERLRERSRARQRSDM
ncbi:DUF433 domain-containing protein [Halobacteriales archaeon QS_3_64_16]|nr:MAG: DUF433 domain-containing protein [Halobacteriales archaeon QS_3_64_16]